MQISLGVCICGGDGVGVGYYQPKREQIGGR